MFRPVDTFTIGWTRSPPADQRTSSSSSSSSHSAPLSSAAAAAADFGIHQQRTPSNIRNRNNDKGEQTIRLDPAASRDGAAGARTNREEGSGKAQATPNRGPSSMSFILSPDSSPTLSTTSLSSSSPSRSGRVNFQATRSQIDLSDPETRRSMKGQVTTISSPPIVSPRRLAASQLLTRSAVSMSSDIDTTPLHTGKGMVATTNVRRESASNSMVLMGGSPERQVTTLRPHTATVRHAQIGSLGFLSTITPTDSPAAMARTLPIARSPTTGNFSSDIFFTDPSHHQDSPLSRRAFTKPMETDEKRSTDVSRTSSPSTSSRIAPFAGRTNASTIFQQRGDSQIPSPSSSSYSSASRSPSSSSTTISTSSLANSPLNKTSSRASLIPQLRIKEMSTNTTAAASDPSDVGFNSADGQMSSRRGGTINARNASSLFDSTSELASYQPSQPIAQIPDVPAKFMNKKKNHIQIRRQRSGVQTIMGWV